MERIESFRQYRTLSPKQRITLDFLFRMPPFDQTPHRQRFALYGGAGWGGKSYLLRTAAIETIWLLRDLGFPNKSVTIYTNTYPDLTDRHIRKFEEEFAGLGTIRETKVHGLHFQPAIPGVGVVYLRNIASDSGAKMKSKRGAESVGAFVDELTELPSYEQFQAILYQTRPSSENLPFIPVLAATNPDGPGHGWVKSVFLPQYRDVEHPFFNGRSVDQCLYVQAFKHDNPAYEMQKEIIDAILQGSTDPDIRRARDEGAWDLYATGRFPMFREGLHGFDDDDLMSKWGIPTNVSYQEMLRMAHELGFELFSSLDFGTSVDSCSSYQVHLVDPDQNVWTADMLSMSGLSIPDQAEAILHFESKMAPIKRRYCDPSLQGRVAEDQSGLTRIDKFRRCGVKFVPAINDRKEGAATIEELLWFRRGDGGRPLSQPRWRIHKHRCRELLRQIGELPRDPRDPEDVDPMGGKWHHYDSARYGLHARFKNSKGPDKSQMLVPGSFAWVRALANQKERSERKWSLRN